ncbi:MAG: FAH family protein, partial [Dongia sp.]
MANLRLVQFKDAEGGRAVGLVGADGKSVRPLKGFDTVYKLAQAAVDRGKSLTSMVESAASSETVDYAPLLQAGKVLPPIDHPEPARFFLTGTGLTHIGSADARNQMHVVTHGSNAPESDSMKIFRMGLKGGKPGPGKIGVQPEWFYKGVGTEVVAPGAPLPLPSFS